MAAATTIQELRAHFAANAAAVVAEAEAFKPILASWRERRAPHILVVDDDEVLTRILLRLLRDMGITAEAARSGPEAIARARAQAFDLVTVDLRLPGPSGMEVVQDLRREGARPPVCILVVSGVVNQAELDEIAAECGADAALAKPFEMEDFEALLRRLLARDDRASLLPDEDSTH